MTIDVLTLFPEMFAPLKTSVIGRALDAGVFDLRLTDIRAYSKDKHLKCDDYPYGGGAGMIMTPQPIYDAIAAVDPQHEARRIYLSPKGETLTAKKAQALAQNERLLFLCGHYEGVDQRVLDLCIDEELSIGDYVLTGGELAAMVTIDSLLRFVPHVLGSEDSARDESFSADLLEYPQYTRPRVFMGLSVPDVLVDGHHGNVDKWRASEARRITKQNRPDLLKEENDT
ncbi:MAG: tRNA (guanosine(37)-N1)-methyltransferase TrmD [Clostridiales bacterium]|nr:tRNA (guanosine(37)-N1)-methyltransferase TrmD [Clostridiales bacterium]